MLSDDEFRQLLLHLNRPWAGFRKVRRGVKKRLRRHMQVLDCQSLGSYLKKIDHQSEARDRCEQCLTVTISRFFRDRHLWAYLQNQVLPHLLQCFPYGLNAWSAGCANGEEPYSLAVLWEEMPSPQKEACALKILASDADAVCLQRASNGVYSASSLKEVPQSFRERWFQKVPGKRQWQIDGQLGKRIKWYPHQLLDPPPIGPFHIIFLRNNLLTYYQGLRLQESFRGILQTLESGGILVIGSHERIPDCDVVLQRDSICPWIFYKGGR